MDPAQQPPAVPAARPAAPRTRKTRLVLLMVGGLVALICLGGAGVAFVAYRDATEPDRSAPDVAVSNYLRAMFVERNDVEAAQYACEEQKDLSQVRGLRAELESREKRFNTAFSVSWGELRTVESGSLADVSVGLQISASIDGVRQTDIQEWTFRVRDADGWRVCEASKL